MKTWRLKKGADRRFRQGHPWIFASELAHSSKEAAAGDVVELVDTQGHFLAYGYAHPSSQICFRRLSSRRQDKDVLSVEYFRARLLAAHRERRQSGWSAASHRWLYAEADGVPGLIVDAFLAVEGGWMVVVQASTAGIERALPEVFAALATFTAEFPDLTIIEASSSKARTLEGLAVAGKRVVQGRARALEDIAIRLHHGLNLNCDLLHGQKTGFFLDQQWNVGLLRQLLRTHFSPSAPVRVLDICSYVGQWSAHVAQALSGHAVHATLVDTSQAALDLAARNVKAAGASEVEPLCGDALKTVAGLGDYDVVICDPPAFVKKKADIAAGVQAYTKLNRDAMKATKPGGLYVASSCSGLVKGEAWQDVLVQASAKAGRTFKRVLVGGHGPDHPTRAEFPEGEYLKCEIGRVEYPY